jgi:hypothetical protein
MVDSTIMHRVLSFVLLLSSLNLLIAVGMSAECAEAANASADMQMTAAHHGTHSAQEPVNSDDRASTTACVAMPSCTVAAAAFAPSVHVIALLSINSSTAELIQPPSVFSSLDTPPPRV